MSRLRGLYRARAAEPIQVGYRHPETNDFTPPNPKQWFAHKSIAEQIFYGGAIGGGKTIWLCLVAIMTCLAFPGVHVAIFRRHYKELQQNVVPQFLALLPARYGRFNVQLGRYTFPNGAVCWFGHCARDSDVYLYQGNQWVKLLIDEASHMTEFIIGYLSTRVRSPRRDALKQLLMGSNPGGPGHGFLKRGWVKPTGWAISDRAFAPSPFEVWRPRPPRDRPTRYMATRQFIPAQFADNTVLQTADPFYLDRVLQALNTTRGESKGEQLAYGNWDVDDGMMFSQDFESEHVVRQDERMLVDTWKFLPNSVIPWHVKPLRSWKPHPSDKIYGCVDYGYSAPFCFYLNAVLGGNHVRTFFELYRSGLRDEHQARAIKSVLEHYMDLGMAKPEWIVYDPQMDGSRAEVNVSETIADVYQRELGDPLRIKLVPGGKEAGARLSRIQRVKEALAPMDDGFPHWDILDTCEHLIRTLPELPKDEDDPEYLDEDGEDHAYEAMGRFFQMRPAPPRSIVPSELELLDPLSRAEQVWKAQRHGELGKSVPHLNVKNLR